MARRVVGLFLVGLLLVPALLSAIMYNAKAQTEVGWAFGTEVKYYEMAWSGTHNNTSISDGAVCIIERVRYDGKPALGVTVIVNITDPKGNRYWFKDGTNNLWDTIRYDGRDDTGKKVGEVIGETANDGVYANLVALGRTNLFGQKPGWNVNLTFYYPGRPVHSFQSFIEVSNPQPDYAHYLASVDLDTNTSKDDWMVWAKPNQTFMATVAFNSSGLCDMPVGCNLLVDAWMAPYSTGEKEIKVGQVNLSQPRIEELSWNFTAPKTPGIYTLSLCGASQGWWPYYNESVLFVGKIIVANKTIPKIWPVSPAKGSTVLDSKPTLTWSSSGQGPSVPTYFLMVDDIDGRSTLFGKTDKTLLPIQTTGKRHQFWSVMVYDGFERTYSTVWDFTVKGDVNNDVAPTATLLGPKDKDKLPDYWVNLSWKGSDPDGDPITYVLQVMYRSNKTIIVNKELTENKTRVFLPEGNFTWTVIPKDPWKTGTCLNGEWNLTVFIPTITQPWSVLLNPTNGKVFVNDSIDFRWDGFDPGQDKLQYKLEVRDQVSGDLYVERYTYDKNLTLWLPPWRYTWTIIPFDGVTWGWCKNGTWSIIVSGPVNLPPVISSPPVAKAWAGRQYSYHVLASDPDKDYLTYSLLEGPSNMTIDERSGLVTWTPGTQDIGTRSITIVVIDGHGGKATQNYIILVSLVPEPVKTKTQAETSLLIFIVIIFALVGVMVTLSARHHRRS